MEKEMKRYLPATEFSSEAQPTQIRFANMPNYIEAYKGRTQDAAWLGCCIAAKLIFPDLKNFMTKQDYNAHGPSVIHLKGY